MPFVAADGCSVEGGPELASVIGLVKERVGTIEELADAIVYFYRRIEPSRALREQHYTAAAVAAIEALRGDLATVDWNRQAIGQAIKQAATRHNLKMPQVAMPLRVMVTGETQTPSIDAVIALIGREQLLAAARAGARAFPALTAGRACRRKSVALQDARLFPVVLLLRDGTRVERLLEID